MASFRVEEGGLDGTLTFHEACGQVNGMKLQGPERRPFRSDRANGDVEIGDLPVRQLESSSAKVEQFADAIMYHPLNVTGNIFDDLYKFSCEGRFSQMPEPFKLKKEPTVPYTMQIIIQSAQPPADGDAHGYYVHIFKHCTCTATRFRVWTAWICVMGTLFGLIGATKPGQPSWDSTSCLIKWEANSYGFG